MLGPAAHSNEAIAILRIGPDRRRSAPAGDDRVLLAAKEHARAQSQFHDLRYFPEAPFNPGRFGAREIERMVDSAARRRHDRHLARRGVNADDEPACPGIMPDRNRHRLTIDPEQFAARQLWRRTMTLRTSHYACAFRTMIIANAA